MGCRSSQKKFSVIDQKLTFGERFSFLHFLQGKKGQNKPENPKMGTFGKSGRFWTKKMALRVAKSKF